MIKWDADTEGPVRITLRKGPRTNLDTLYQIVLLEYNWGNYTWDVPADTPAGKDYAFEMKWGQSPGPDDVNYTGLFEITSDGQGAYGSTTTTESSYPSETSSDSATETATETTAETTIETPTGTYSNETSSETGKGSHSTATSGPTGSKNNTTRTSSGPTTSPHAKDDNSSAGVIGASVGMAAAIALGAAAFL